MQDFQLGGLVAAPYTPFDASGDLRLSVIEQYAERLVATGVKAAFVCGTTGEGFSLTTAERMDVARRWVEVAGKSLNVVVHVGHNAQREAVALADHARSVGAAAVAALPPFFFKPANVAHLVDFCAPIAAAGGDLPFYYYHIPSMTGVTLPMPDFLEAAAGRVPNLRGIKFTHGDIMEYQRCHKLMAGRFEIAWGFDEMLLGGLAVGARSAVGSTYNYAAPLYTKMIAAFDAGDLAAARKCSYMAVEMVAVLLKYGVLRTGKATLSLAGVDCGPTRSPIAPLTPDELAAARSAYEKIGVLPVITTGKEPTVP